MPQTFSIEDGRPDAPATFSIKEGAPPKTFSVSDGDPKSTTATGAFTRSAATGVAPALGAWGGFKSGALIGEAAGGGPEDPVADVLGLVGGGVGALIGSIMADKGQKAALKAVAPNVHDELEKFQQEDLKDHPIASVAGSLAANLPVFKLNPLLAARGAAAVVKIAKGTAFKSLSATEQQAAKALAVQTGFGAGMGVVAPLVQGQRPTLGDVSQSVATAMLFGNPRFEKAPSEPQPKKTADEPLSSQPAQATAAPAAPVASADEIKAAIDANFAKTPPSSRPSPPGEGESQTDLDAKFNAGWAKSVAAGSVRPTETETSIVGAPVKAVPSAQITTRPDLMQFKRMDNADTGENNVEKLSGKWDDLKGGNMLLWEPKDPAQYGLAPGEKYIVANGHHRFAFGESQDVPAYNAQIVREADGYSAGDAARLGAEINIADGKGTIYDQTKYIRNIAATHGADEAVAAARRIGARGRPATDIAISAGPALYDSFVNEQVNPEVTRAIANAAPQNEALQRLGVKYYAKGKTADYIVNLLKATQLEAGPKATDIDLFGNDDSAMRDMEAQAERASQFQRDIKQRLGVLQAGKKSEIAASEGIDVKNPQAIPARIAQLKTELQRWDNWPLQPDLVAKVKGETAKTPSAPSPETPPPTAKSAPKQTAPGATGEEISKRKEPWQATQAEYVKRYSTKSVDVPDNAARWKAIHKDIIKQALTEGKPVPSEVLKDYPELTSPAKFTPPAKEELTLRAPTEEELKAEEAAAEEKRLREKMLDAAAKPLAGTSGDLGQGDLIDGPKDLFAPGKPVVAETIKSAAIRAADGTIYTGQWHPAAYEKYMADKGVSKAQAISEQQSGKIKDGFLTSSGRFVDRDEAAQIASKASQFKPDKEGDVAFAGALKGLDRESKIIKPGRVEGMGGRMSAASASAKATRTQQQNVPAAKAAVQQLQSATSGVIQSGLTPAATKPKYFTTLRANFNPMSLGESAKQTATVLRYMLGKRYVAEQRFDTVMAKFRNAFDRFTTPRNYQYDPAKPLPPNWELQRAIDTGDTANLTPLETQFATEARKLLDAAVRRVQSLKPDVLQQLHEFYFPRNWVDATGKDASEAALRLSQSHRPFAGAKTFLKQRSLALWDDALKLGLKPRFDNPADMLRSKLGEMEQFASALEAHNELKSQGVKRFRYIFEKMPEGWTNKIDDPGTKVFAPPTVTIKEAFDEQIRVKTLEMFKALGISNDRLESIGGSKRWGWARENPEHVRTKFGGTDSVFWHEFGHIMDYRYGDLRDALGLNGSKATDDELRALADARLPEGDDGTRTRVNKNTGKTYKGRSAFSSYTRKAEEKMANVFDAYLRAPDLFRAKAPTVFNNLLRWLELHPEVKGPLNDIRPSLRWQQGTTEKFVGGPILLGDWIMPEPAARVMNNYLQPGVWAKAKGLTGIKKLGGMISNVRLISAFHGQMVGNDALASGISLPLYDAMKAVADRDPKLLKRGATDFLKAPARPFLALAQGSKMLRAIRGDASVDQLNKELAQYAVDANLRAGHMNIVENSSRRWKQSLFEARNAIKRGENPLPAALDLFLQTPLALGHEMMRPVMEWFVPRMKYGLAAPMLQRIIADNPNADEWELRRKFGQAGDSVEDRVGQVTYDNLFQSRAVKDSGQLALQAYGWHLTKERMLWGAASDYAKAGKAMLTGRKPDITFRMAYLPALVMTHAIIGGTIMYALTGRKPSKLIDYLFPETGLVDAYGKPVRLAIADFLKDYVGEWNAAMHGPKAVITEWEQRLMPVWNELADMYRNRDFYNTKIFSERNFDEPEYQHVWKNLGEAVNYMANSSAPFSVKGAQRFTQSLGADSTETQKALAHFGPFFGFVPAPQALTQSPAEAKAAEIMRDSLPPMSKDQSAHVQAISQLVHDIRTGKINDEGTFEARARAAKVTDKAELTRIQERVLWTPLQYQLHKLPLYQPGTGRDAMTVWDLMSDKEKVSTAQIFADKIQRAYDGGKLDVPTTSRMVRLVMPYLKAAAAAKSKVQSPKPGELRSFQE